LEFRAISYIWKTITAKRMEIHPYCRQNCSPLDVLFIDVYIDFVDIARRSSTRGLQLHYTAWRGFVSDSCAFLFLCWCQTSSPHSNGFPPSEWRGQTRDGWGKAIF